VFLHCAGRHAILRKLSKRELIIISLVLHKLVTAVRSIAFSLIKDFFQNAKRSTEELRYCLLTKRRTNLKLLCIIFLSLVEVLLNIGRAWSPGDSDRYVDFALFLMGKQPLLYNQWLYTQIVVMRPMIPLLASLLILVLGNIYLSFGLVSGLFWLGGGIVSYKLGLILLKDKSLATLVALSFILAPPLLLYGAGVMTESAGFFFIGLAIYLTLKREQQDRVSSGTYFLDALIVSFGVLFKESVLFALIFMIVKRFMNRRGFHETLLAATLVGFLELLYLYALGFGPYIFIYKYNLATLVEKPQNWGIIPYLFSLKAAYVTNVGAPRPYFSSLAFWIWILPTLLYGLFAALGFMSKARRKDLLMCLLCLFPSTVIWPAMIERFSFSMWPAVLPAIVSGAYSLFSRLPLPKNRVISNPKIFILIFILFLGLINTVYTLIHYPSLTITL